MKRIKSLFKVLFEALARNAVAIFVVGVVVVFFFGIISNLRTEREQYVNIIKAYNERLQLARNFGFAGFDIYASIPGTELATTTVVSIDARCNTAPLGDNGGIRSLAIICNPQQ